MGLIMKNGIQYPGVGSGEGSGLEISQLDDVKITPPLADKESLVYNGEIGKWENKVIENSLPYNLVLSEKWDNNISGGASENTVWTSKIFLTKGTYSIYDYVSWQSSMRIYYTYYFIERSDDFEGCFHGSQGNSQINVSSDTQGWACFTTNEQFTIIKGTAKIQLKFWGSSGPAYDGGGLVSLYKIDGLNNSSGITELPIASAETLGGIKVGENLTITEDGTLNAKASSGTSQVIYGGIDITNVIYELTSSVEGTEWVATEDCYFIGELIGGNNNSSNFFIDGISVGSHYSSSTISSSHFPILVLKGQTVKYKAMSSDFIRTGKFYGIKKSENILHNYSEDEKIVGTWIDRKPIYEKTFTDLRLLNRTDCIIDLSSLNIENVINAYGLCHRLANDGGSFDYTLPFFESAELYVNMRYNKNPKNYSIWCSDSSGTYTANLTIQYTKTID